MATPAPLLCTSLMFDLRGVRVRCLGMNKEVFISISCVPLQLYSLPIHIVYLQNLPIFYYLVIGKLTYANYLPLDIYIYIYI